MNSLYLDRDCLMWQDRIVLTGLSHDVSVVAAPAEFGALLRFQAEKPAARHLLPVGRIAGASRFTACHRYEPFWMKPCAGTAVGQVPPETQSLLVEREDGLILLLIPLIDRDIKRGFRAALQGGDDNLLMITLESGDPSIARTHMVGLYAAVGEDPYALAMDGARAVAEFLRIGRLAADKPNPEFIDQFGWCTWDAFYQEVSHDKVREGLESFRDGGVLPRYLILDDGWQSVTTRPSGEVRLSAFAANEKFPGGLAPTVQMAKEEFGVERFLVWHAMTGYWGGVDGDTLPGYGVSARPRSFSPGILHHSPTINNWWGGVVGAVSPDCIDRFFHDYHRELAAQGVDGVKVDTQATLEGVATGFGGRVEMMRRYREALEGSAQVHFEGRLINCMSCANEMLYAAASSTVTRTSTDFWPDRPHSHGEHLYTNAQVSVWFSQFVQPDWDMFQSGHAMGSYHAAGRAVSGGPVYVSDKPGKQDFALLRKLVLPDGSIARCIQAGMPSRDCLFRNPMHEEVLLKIFNKNPQGDVLGVFHALTTPEGQEPKSITGAVRIADVAHACCERFAVFAHRANELRSMTRDDSWEITLGPQEWELFTIVSTDSPMPLVGMIGVTDLLNSSGVVDMPTYHVEIADDGSAGFVEYRLECPGHIVAWCEQRPSRILTSLSIEGENVYELADLPFAYDEDSGRLDADVPAAFDSTLRFEFDA